MPSTVNANWLLNWLWNKPSWIAQMAAIDKVSKIHNFLSSTTFFGCLSSFCICFREIFRWLSSGHIISMISWFKRLVESCYFNGYSPIRCLLEGILWKEQIVAHNLVSIKRYRFSHSGRLVYWEVTAFRRNRHLHLIGGLEKFPSFLLSSARSLRLHNRSNWMEFGFVRFSFVLRFVANCNPCDRSRINARPTVLFVCVFVSFECVSKTFILQILRPHSASVLWWFSYMCVYLPIFMCVFVCTFRYFSWTRVSSVGRFNMYFI